MEKKLNTYTNLLAAVRNISARSYALKAPKIDAGTEAHEAYRAAKSAINEEAKAMGFIRLFDGS